MATAYKPSLVPPRQENSQAALASSPNLGGNWDQSQGGVSTPVAEGPLLPLPGADQRERRRESRHPTNHAAVLTEVNPLTFGTTSALLKEVSRNGVKVHLSHLLYPGAMVHLRVGKLIVVAEVRYCVRFTAGYMAGMAILDVFPRDGSAFSNVFSNCIDPDAA